MSTTSTYKPPSDPEVRERRCLPCGKYFLSEHAGNRVCPRCRGLKDRGLGRIDVDAQTAMYGGVRKGMRGSF